MSGSEVEGVDSVGWTFHQLEVDAAGAVGSALRGVVAVERVVAGGVRDGWFGPGLERQAGGDSRIRGSIYAMALRESSFTSRGWFVAIPMRMSSFTTGSVTPTCI